MASGKLSATGVPLEIAAKNITFRQRDLMQERLDMDGYTDSLSCLHKRDTGWHDLMPRMRGSSHCLNR